MIARYIIHLQEPLLLTEGAILQVVYCDRDRIILDKYDPDAPQIEQIPAIGVHVEETVKTSDKLG